MEYTLAEVAVFLEAMRERKKEEALLLLGVVRVANHGTKEDVDSYIRELR